MGVIKVVLQALSASLKHPLEMHLGRETDLLWQDRHPGHLLERRMEYDLFKIPIFLAFITLPQR